MLDNDDAVVKIISRLGVDYSQALMGTKTLAAETAALDKQLKMLKVTAADLGKAGGTGVAQQFMGDKVIYDQYGKVISVAAINTKVLNDSVKTADQTAKNHKQTVKELSDQYNVLGSQFERRAGWFVAGTAFFGSIAAAGAAVKTITDIEMGMTQIARITEDVTFNFNEMRDDLLKLGKEYGMTWDSAQDIALRFAQAGYDVKDTLELTESAFLALNTAELDAEQSTSGFIAILAQWGMTAEQLLPTLDKINKVADDYAITSQDLVDGLIRSSGAAKVLGLSLNETIAILTVMREATGRTGREVGNALNSILSFMQRDVALKAFAREGIAVWADEAHTEFRNFIDIFDEVAARWQGGALTEASMDMFTDAAEQVGLYSEELAELAGAQKEFTDLQQRDISQSMAGIYRRNYLLALLRNWSKVQEVLNTQLDASGYSMRENERTMETLAKQYDQLKVTAQQLAVAIGDAGLLDQLKDVTSGARDAVAWFGELDPTLRNLIINFIEVTAALKILNAVFKMAGFSGLAASATNAAAAIGGLAGTAAGLGAVMLNVGKGITAFFGGPWGLAIVAAATGIGVLVKHMKQQEAQAEENARAASGLIKEYDRLNNQLVSTKKDTDEYNILQDKLKSTMNAIADIMPNVVTKWDAMGNAIAFNNDKLRENIALAKEAAAANLEQSLSVAYRKKQTLSEQMALFEEEQRRTQSGQPPESEWKFRITGKGALIIPDPANMQEIRQELSAVGEEIRQITELMAGGASDVGIGLPKGGGDGGGSEDKGKYKDKDKDEDKAEAAAKQADYIKKLIDLNLQYADAQGLVNQATQREISLAGARIGYYRDSAASMEDYLKLASEENRLTGLLEQKQLGLHEEAEALRQALVNLQEAHESVDRSTGEGQDAYAKLGEEIERVRERIGGLSVEWWNLAKDQHDILDRQYRDYTQWMDRLHELEAITLEERLRALDSFDKTKLSMGEQMEYMRRYYDTLMEYIDEAYSKDIEAISAAEEAFKKASDARIAVLEEQLEVMKEQNAELEEERKIQDALQNIEKARLSLREAREKLENVQAEKSVRIFRDGIWDYIADPKAVKDAQEAVDAANEKLADAQESHNDIIMRIERDAEEKRIKEKIEAERKAQEIALESYKQQKEDLEDHLEEIKRAITDGGEGIDALLDGNVFPAIDLTIDSWLRKMADNVAEYCSRMRSDFASVAAMYGGGDVAMPQYAAGGPILGRQIAMLHPNEYVLTADDVRKLGGFAGVERLRLNIRNPVNDLSPDAYRLNVSKSTSTSVDRSVKISGPIQLPHVYDAAGLVRNLRRLAQG